VYYIINPGVGKQVKILNLDKLALDAKKSFDLLTIEISASLFISKNFTVRVYKDPNNWSRSSIG